MYPRYPPLQLPPLLLVFRPFLTDIDRDRFDNLDELTRMDDTVRVERGETGGGEGRVHFCEGVDGEGGAFEEEDDGVGGEGVEVGI